MKQLSVAALLLMLLSLSVICQAELLATRFIVEHTQTSRSFSLKHVLNSLSGTPSDVADTNGFAESIFLPDDKPPRFVGYGAKTTFIESISWQLFYATNLLVAYELILTTNDATPGGKPYSWIPVEAFLAVGWLLKSYWNFDSLLFNPMKQQVASQNDPFAITIMMLPGRGQQQNGQQQSRSSSSSGQQVSGSTTHATGFFNPSSSDSGGGSGGSEQQRHTLGLNCYVDSCHGVCKLSQSSDNSAEGPLISVVNSLENSTAHMEATPGQVSSPDITSRSFTSPLVYFDRNTFIPVTDAPPDELYNQFFVDFSDIHRIDINLTNGCMSPRSLLWVSPRHP
ncbi:hypothetical protein [Endozoicomonas sp. 2B-B]